ncbi:MAG: hypothetical protein H0T88_00425, partial [Lysobacter sp.]|nr:hypothetical protein [Lysobacter sp.]
MSDDRVDDWPVVYSLHGIRTTGKWQKDLTDELLKNGFRHRALDFGYFLAISLILPWTRRKKVRWLLDLYDREISELSPPPSFIAHSYGTYLLTEALKKNSNMRLGKLILCGSIVRRDYPWSKILINRGQAELVLHERGGRDFWAKVVCWVVSDAGPSGVEGFLDKAAPPDPPLVHEIIHAQHEHSDFFFLQNYRERWIPFLKEGKLPAEEVALDTPGLNFKFAAVALVILSFIVAIGFYLCRELWLVPSPDGVVEPTRSPGVVATATATATAPSPGSKAAPPNQTQPVVVAGPSPVGLNWAGSSTFDEGQRLVMEQLTVENLGDSPFKRLQAGLDVYYTSPLSLSTLPELSV